MCESFSWFISSPTLGRLSFFILKILIHGQMLSHCSLICIFLMKSVEYLVYFDIYLFSQIFDLLKLCFIIECWEFFIYSGFKRFIRYWSLSIIPQWLVFSIEFSPLLTVTCKNQMFFLSFYPYFSFMVCILFKIFQTSVTKMSWFVFFYKFTVSDSKLRFSIHFAFTFSEEYGSRFIFLYMDF